MTDAADLAERALEVIEEAFDAANHAVAYHKTTQTIERAFWEELIPHVAAFAQSEREAAAAEARRAAIEECAQIADNAAKFVDIKPHRIKFVSPEQYAADLARDIADGIRALASPPGPQIIRDSAGFPVMGTPPTLPCYCDETQCYSADMQPGWHCKKQAR